VVHVIDVPASRDGVSVKVITDPKTRRAVCFLDKG